MKFICIADIHLSMYSQDPIIHGTPERLYHLNLVLRNIADYAVANGIRVMVIAGDVFHTKSVIHSLAQSVLLDFVRYYRELIVFYIIDGNHDMSSKSGEGVSALKCLDREITWMIHEPIKVQNILFVPWNPKTMKQDIAKGEAEYLISHLGLNEAELSSGISIVSDIKLRDLKHYKKCILGHYHKPQELGNVVIPGSVVQLDWGEKHEEKRFLIVDTEKHTMESVPTEGYRKHYVLELTSDNKNEVTEQAQEMKDGGHYVKIHRMSSDVDISDLQDNFRVVDKVERDITNRGIDSTMSTTDKLNRYMEIREIPEKDRSKYLKCAMNIISAVEE